MKLITEGDIESYFTTRGNRFRNQEGMEFGMGQWDGIWTTNNLCDYNHGPLAIDISTEGDRPAEFISGLALASCLTGIYSGLSGNFVMELEAPSPVLLALGGLIFAIRVTYLPVIVLLLYKRRKAGWILLMINRTLDLLSAGLSFFYLLEYPVMEQGDAESQIWPGMLNGFFILFLWGKEIRGYFRVTKRVMCYGWS